MGTFMAKEPIEFIVVKGGGMAKGRYRAASTHVDYGDERPDELDIRQIELIEASTEIPNTVAVNPEAIRKVLNYLWHDECNDWHSRDESQQEEHIFSALCELLNALHGYSLTPGDWWFETVVERYRRTTEGNLDHA